MAAKTIKKDGIAKKIFKRSDEPGRLSERVRAELIGIGLLILCTFLVLAIFSFSGEDPSFNTTGGDEVKNLMGVAGSYVADLVIILLGCAAYFLPLAILVFAVRYMLLRPVKHPGWVALGYTILTFTVSAMFSLGLGKVELGGREELAGGLVGFLLADPQQGLLVRLLNVPGAWLVLGASLLSALMFTVNFSLYGFGEGLRGGLMSIVHRLRDRWIMRREQKAKQKAKKEEEKARKGPAAKPAPKIIADADQTVRPAPAMQESMEFMREKDGYKLPPAGILKPGDNGDGGPDEESLLMSSKLLLKKLQDFGIEGEVVTVRPGPVVTMFEFKPAAGVKINRIVNLSDDLALALRALSIRIVAPIPGKDTVGVEIPNTNREIVTLGDVIDSSAYRGTESSLPLALGKDISGNPVVADLAKMPHLLIAGATGSGKSVAVHAMLASLLQRATPQEVKLLIVDPKMLELSVYDDIPHLLLPVVTEAKQAAVALRWAVAEMERRYRLMAEEGVRNITTYNKKVEKRIASKRPGPSAEEENLELLPFIVVIIDELADLMMVASKEVEESIARLAQMARAAGIHLIVATQRPSVDVITGMIKANFPARIAFQVASRIDSRTILDTMGAETLLGGGDMLFLPPGTAKLMRVHGSFVSEQEIADLVKYLRKQGQPEYDESILEDPAEDGFDGELEFDQFYDQAVAFVTESRQASVSMIQRKFKIGYNRAARIIEVMEREGVVGPSRGAKPREVLARKV